MESHDDYSDLLVIFTNKRKEFDRIKRQYVGSRELNLDDTFVQQRKELHDDVSKLKDDIAAKHTQLLETIKRNSEFEKRLKMFLLKATEHNHVENMQKINTQLTELLANSTELIKQEKNFTNLKIHTDKLLLAINADIMQDQVQQRIKKDKEQRKIGRSVMKLSPKKRVLYQHEPIPIEQLEQYLPDRPNVTLREHQLRVIKHVLTHRGTIAVHSMGSGKTLIAVTAAKAVLQAMRQKNKQIQLIFISPKSLTANFKDQMIKAYHSNDFTDYHFYGYDAFYRAYKRDEIDCTNTFLIIDEAHNLRTKLDNPRKQGKRAKKIIGCAKKAFKVLLLTGTPIINNPYDIANLIAMVDGTDPVSEEKFDMMLNPKNADLFNDFFSCKLSFYQHPYDEASFPSTEEHRLEMEMSDDYYQKYLKIQANTSDFFGSEANLAVFYNGLRKAATTHMTDDEIIDNNPKLVWLKQHLLSNPQRRTVIFAQFIEFGVEQIAKICRDIGIKFLQITGKTDKEERSRIVNEYNKRNISLVIISKAGGEGLNLLETADFILMSPGWNPAEREQAIARSVRFMSHARLSPSKRHVDIYKLILKKPEILAIGDPKAESIDEILDALSDRKAERNERFLNRLRPLSIENDNNACDVEVVDLPHRRGELEEEDEELNDEIDNFFGEGDGEGDGEGESKKRGREEEDEEFIEDKRVKEHEEEGDVEFEGVEGVEFDDELLQQIFREEAEAGNDDEEMEFAQSSE